MKLPIQAQPVSRKVSSTMLTKKRTNAVGASLSCAECAIHIPTCGWIMLDEGPDPFRDCLVRHGAGECYDCGKEITEWIASTGRPGGNPPGGGFTHLE